MGYYFELSEEDDFVVAMHNFYHALREAENYEDITTIFIANVSLYEN